MKPSSIFRDRIVTRKIIHIDMDAFYASVEQRDRPALQGQPVIVAWRGGRSVVCAASYEARRYGVHSAMPAVHAERLCPQGIFVAPDFPRYKAVSRTIHELFAAYTDRIQPLSLDEAYLDVTDAYVDSATEVARAVRQDIRNTTALTASAGVAPNKFLAKVASDWDKPDGLTVIPPSRVEAFLLPLEVARIPGVGPVMQQNLARLGIHTVADLRQHDEAQLQARFGSAGTRLHNLAYGIDEGSVEPRGPGKQVSAEDTFETDLTLAELTPHIQRMAAKTWAAHQRRAERVARTVTLKLKTADFRILTRSDTPATVPASADQLADLACALRQRVDEPADTRYRLVGVGLSGFVDDAEHAWQGDLFLSPTSS